MTPIHVSGNYVLSEGYNEYLIESERDLDLSFVANVHADVFVRIKKASKVRVRFFASDRTKVNILYWNESDAMVDADESYEVQSGGYLHVAYAEMNDQASNHHVYMALRGEGAEGMFSSAALVSDKKQFHMQVVNFARHTIGRMENYSVVLNGGKYNMDAVGTIVKGASNSQNHQTSRSLSFDMGQSSKITPILEIDENEVEASHAMTVGTIDPDQLYYMMSRGLTRAECTKIISTGYLLPIVDLINNEELQKALQSEMEEKIGSIC